MNNKYKMNAIVICYVGTANHSNPPIGLVLVIIVILIMILVVVTFILFVLWSEFNLLHAASHMC